MNNVKRVMIVTPAQSFTPEYVVSLHRTMAYAASVNIQVGLCHHSGSHIGQLRELMLDKIRTSREPYDRLLWIDSDIFWTFEDFCKIIDSPHEITVGAYMISPEGRLSVVKQFASEATETCEDALNWTEPEPQHFYAEELDNLPRYVNTYSSGLGFCSMKRGVFSKLESPYFANVTEMNPVTKKMEISTSEDCALFLKARRAGIECVLDTTIRLSHVKPHIWSIDGNS